MHRDAYEPVHRWSILGTLIVIAAALALYAADWAKIIAMLQGR